MPILGTPATGGITPTATEVMNEGQFQLAQFPLCANQAALDTLIGQRVTLFSTRLRASNPGLHGTTDLDKQAVVKQYLIWLTCASMWQTILSTMAGYDAEALPPEFVHPEVGENLRDTYGQMAADLIAPFDTILGDDPKFAQPYFSAAGTETLDPAPVSIVATWADTGVRPE